MFLTCRLSILLPSSGTTATAIQSHSEVVAQLESTINLLLLVLGLIAVLLIVVVVISLKQNALRKNLKKKCEQLEETNRSLQESNRIKDSVVTEYMKQCRAGIGKLQNFQQMLQRLAMTRNTDRLVEAIRNAENVEPLLDTFYESFDAAFLNLYPEFFAELNAHLSPDEQYAITQHLTTELRVFALMRLGVTDLDEIAAFLRCAPKTVLNYRSRLRQKALIDKDELDKIILHGKND